MALIGAVQSRLLTSRAALSPSKLEEAARPAPAGSRPTRRRSLAVLSVRSAVGRGSPIRPVDPPTSPSGSWPASWSRRISRSCTRLPRCRLGAVGSKPQ